MSQVVFANFVTMLPKPSSEPAPLAKVRAGKIDQGGSSFRSANAFSSFIYVLTTDYLLKGLP